MATFVAVRLGKANTWSLFASLLVVACTMLLSPSQFMDTYLFISFASLMLVTLISLTLDLRNQQQQHEAALLVSSRLEIELLKKNIQPHFILNTLTAVEEWIEESPKTAIQFIDALADEFRNMSIMAHKKLVPLTQEIELCRSHLKIMGFRKNINFYLEENIETNKILVPPAIFHTIIENAITHNNYRQGLITFKFTQKQLNNHSVCTLLTPLLAGKVQQTHGIESGTGMRYIKARLEESFAGAWELKEEIAEGYWVTKITIPEVFSDSSPC